MKKLVLIVVLSIVLISYAFEPPKYPKIVTVPLGEVVDERFFQCIDSFINPKHIQSKSYYKLGFYAYNDSAFIYENRDRNFSVDSLYWITLYYIPAIDWDDVYLVRYKQSRYLIPKNIVKHGNIVRPIGKKRRIDQEYELTLYYHPTLILWHPDGSIVEIPDTTDLYMPLVE